MIPSSSYFVLRGSRALLCAGLTVQQHAMHRLLCSATGTTTAAVGGGDTAANISSNAAMVVNHKNPAEVVQNASKLLQDVTEKLKSIQSKLQTPFTLSTGKEVTVPDIVFHSRDCKPNEFNTYIAKEARTKALTQAERIEQELQEMSTLYMDQVVPYMEAATKICQETKCGGATWEFDIDAMKQNQSNEEHLQHIQGKDTPCGKLQLQGMEFLQLTYDTKQDVVLGSRAALILRLAHKQLDMPLSFARKKPELQQQIGQTFAQQVVATPWLRSDEEYQQLLEIQEEITELEKSQQDDEEKEEEK